MNTKGYTLIELLVAVSIIGLVFSSGFVSFREFSRRQEIASLARSLEGELRSIQQKALSGEKPDDIFCNPPNTLSGYTFDLTSGTSYSISAVCTGGLVEIKTKDMPEGLTIETTLDPITFKVLGSGTDIPAGDQSRITITQTATGSFQEVIVTSGGEIK